MGIGTLEVYPIGYQLLRKLDCLQVIRILRMIIPYDAYGINDNTI